LDLREQSDRRLEKLHNEELHNLYSLPNVVRMIKSRRMIWAGHIVCMGDMRNAYRILNPLNLAVVHLLCCLPHRETDDGTHTTVTLKIYSKRTPCSIDIGVSLFDSAKFVVLWLKSRGLCIIAV
jgi:hypothetical protein